MKKVEKPIKYILISGDEELLRAQSLQQICDYLGCSYMWVSINKRKKTKPDGTFSFNYLDYSYTVTIIN